MRLTIDDRELEVADGTTVLAAADRLGLRIPRFCHHPRLSSPGNCRMCVVEVEGAEELVISCREPVRDGMKVRTDTPEVRQARADVLEFMLLNHPLDCPVCDQSGECALQELYFEHSQRPSRLMDPKVRKRKAARIGPHVMLDAERCVQCTRCVRFCDEVVGRHEIGLCERSDRTEISVSAGIEFSNAYSLCAVDICPVGALTSIDFRFKKRVWYLSSSPTICTGCSRGCNVWLDRSEGVPYRMRSRENEAVNKSWMCDYGRMTYKRALSVNRLQTPLILSDHEMKEVAWKDALLRLTELVSAGARDCVCVLSARSSIEENLAFMRLCRELLGARRFYYTGSDPDPSFADSILRTADKNPNFAGVSMIADGPMGELPQKCGVAILDGLAAGELMELVSASPAWTLLVTAEKQQSGSWADVVLPKATHFEQQGTFISAGNILQRADAALDPPAGVPPAWAVAGRIANAMGLDWEMMDAAACRAWGKANIQALAKMEGSL